MESGTYRRSRSILVAALITCALIITAIGTPGVAAQPTPVPASEFVRTISVSGTGIVSVTPDTASVTLGMEARNESLQAAQDEVTRRIRAATEVITGLGVAEDDIQTSNYSIYPVPEYDRNGNYVGILHYEVTVTLTVTVRDLDSLGPILEESVGAGVNNIWDISMYVDDTSAPASQARASAMEDARAKADEYARASGVVITGVFSIDETAAPEPKSTEMRTDMPMAADAEAAEESAMPVPINPGQSEIRVDVDVVFTVEQGNG